MARFTLPRDLYFGENALETLKTIKGNKAAPDKRSCLSSQPSPPARSGDGSESSIDFEAIRQYMTHGSTDQTLCSS